MIKFHDILWGILVLTLSACSTPKDSLDKAKEVSNQQRPMQGQSDAEFLISMSEARMMDFSEGQLATRKATLPALRDYGRLMEHDQTELLRKMNSLAAQQKIVLPEKIGEVKKSALKDLQTFRGKNFDQKFISMITIDHERDVKEFKKASEDVAYVSESIKDFAKENLALIESHLKKIKALTP